MSSRTWVALFRGINVGGANILPMRDLVGVLEEVGCRDVRTYIQSGNAVFRHAEGSASRLAARIGDAVRSRRGFEPAVLVMGVESLEHAVHANPFPEGETDPSKLAVYFLTAVPEDPDLEAIESLRIASECFALIGRFAYLYAPDGLARSKLAARMERVLGVSATARNWRSLTKILAMARESG